MSERDAIVAEAGSIAWILTTGVVDPVVIAASAVGLAANGAALVFLARHRCAVTALAAVCGRAAEGNLKALVVGIAEGGGLGRLAKARGLVYLRRPSIARRKAGRWLAPIL